MSGDLVRRGSAAIDLMGDDFDRVTRIATGLAQSGIFKDVPNTQNAMAKILLGADLGLTPTQALMNIDVVEGNARVRSNQLAAWVRMHERYDYKVRAHTVTECAIEFFYDGESQGVSEFSMEDAANAKLIKEHPKSPWRAHPRNMLWARAMSNGVRWYCPDLTGGISVYTEADEFTDATAQEIGAGEGSGEAPEWEGVTPEAAAHIEALVERAEALDFPGLGGLAIIRMRLNGQKPEAVAEWIAAAEEQLAMVEPKDPS